MTAIAEGFLRPDERIEAIGVANVGRSPTRQIVTSAVKHAGLWLTVPLRHFIVLTDTRLLFFLQTSTGRPKNELAGELSRAGVAVLERKPSGLHHSLVLGVAGTDEPLAFFFPVSEWADERELARHLGADAK